MVESRRFGINRRVIGSSPISGAILAALQLIPALSWFLLLANLIHGKSSNPQRNPHLHPLRRTRDAPQGRNRIPSEAHGPHWGAAHSLARDEDLRAPWF